MLPEEKSGCEKNSIFVLCHFHLLTLCLPSWSVALHLFNCFSMNITFKEPFVVGLTISPKLQCILSDSQANVWIYLSTSIHQRGIHKSSKVLGSRERLTEVCQQYDLFFCTRQVLGPGARGRPRAIGWRGRWEGGSGWGTHVNPWLIHFNVWQNPLQYCKVISLQLIKKSKKK